MGNKYTESQKKATYKYMENKVKLQITITPEQRERYKKMASDEGISLTELIINALDKRASQ